MANALAKPTEPEPELDGPRRLLLSLTRRRGDPPGKPTLRDLSLKIGRNHAYLQQFVESWTPKDLPEEPRKRLAAELGIDERDLRGQSLRETTYVDQPAQNARIGEGVRFDVKLKAYGHAMGGKYGEFPLNGNEIGEVLAPAKLANIRDAYAVVVAGDSMEPRYHAKECVYVNPRAAITKGCYVVAQIRAKNAPEGDPPLAYIKQFVSRDDRRLRLQQFNPRKTLEFPTKDVVSVHRIIGSTED